MSLRSSVRAFPVLLKTGFLEAVAYRAEMFIWVLSTTMPLIMMALWTSVARDAPVGRFQGADFVSYFLATFVVRQLTGSWAAWEINFEVRQGTLAMRLLRPISPLWSYAAENLGALPLRLVVAVPVTLLAVSLVGTRVLPPDALGWVAFFLALLGGWLITFLANVLLGTLSLFMESSLKVMDVWLAFFFVFSGYLYPVELFPPSLQAVASWLPFRYQIGLPVELMTGMHRGSEMWSLLLRQWLWVAALFGLGQLLWRRGLQRFAAFGG